jgi:hypothetical protein
MHALLPFTRIFENLKKNPSGEPFEKKIEKSQREEGEIPRFRSGQCACGIRAQRPAG